MENFSIEYAKREKPFIMKENHFHNHYEIYFLLSGSIKYFIDGSLHYLTKGSLALIKPNVLHRTVSACHHGHERVLVMLSRDFVTHIVGEERMDECFEVPVRLIAAHEYDKAAALLRELSEEQRSPKPDAAMLAALMAQLVIRICRAPAAAVNVSDGGTQEQRILEMVAYIDENYAEDIDRDMLCKKIFISPSHFSHSFKSVTGFTYVEYLNRVRIRNAMRMLKQTNVSVTRVAAATGFASPNHFCKTFRAVTGISPSNYKKI